jgi:hypothetical protein
MMREAVGNFVPAQSAAFDGKLVSDLSLQMSCRWIASQGD